MIFKALPNREIAIAGLAAMVLIAGSLPGRAALRIDLLTLMAGLVCLTIAAAAVIALRRVPTAPLSSLPTLPLRVMRAAHPLPLAQMRAVSRAWADLDKDDPARLNEGQVYLVRRGTRLVAHATVRQGRMTQLHHVEAAADHLSRMILGVDSAAPDHHATRPIAPARHGEGTRLHNFQFEPLSHSCDASVSFAGGTN